MDWLVSAVFIAVYLGMFLGGLPGLALDRTGIAVLGAIILLASGRLSQQNALEALDVPTLALLLGLMVVSAQLRLGGFYTYVTQRLAGISARPPQLLGLLIALAGLLSAVLVNDVICLAMTPVLALGCLRRELNPVPFLLALACASNIGSALTLIGNPQNMLIGQVLRLDFVGYLLGCALPVVLSLAACWAIIAWLMRGQWTLPGHAEHDLDAATQQRRRGTDWPALDRWQAAKGLGVLTLLVAVMLAGLFPREIAALAAAGLLMCSRRMSSREMLGLVDWQLLALFAGLFVVNHSFEQSGQLAQLLASLRHTGLDPAQPAQLFVMTAVLSNLVSNVPAVMLLLPAVFQAVEAGSLTLSGSGVLLGLASTLAGNLLLVGSIANLIVAEQAHSLGIALSWRDHARIGVPVTLATLAIAWLCLAARGV